MIARNLSAVFAILTLLLGMLSLDIPGSSAQDVDPLTLHPRGVGSGEGYEGLPQWDGDIPINRQDPGNPEVLKQMRELTLEMAKNSKPVPAGGETTAGSTILIAGKSIKLPDDVYVAHYIAALSCLVGSTAYSCPQAPVYHLMQKGTNFEISVSAVDGQIVDPDNAPEFTAASRQAFQWLVNAVSAQAEK